jgi:hypothetical protein
MFGITNRIDKFVGNRVNPNGNNGHGNISPMQQRDNIVSSLFAQSGMPIPNLQSAPIFPYPPIYAANNEQLLFNDVSSHLQHMGFTGNLQNRENDIFGVVVDILKNKNIPEHNINNLANHITSQYLHQQFSRTQQPTNHYLATPSLAHPYLQTNNFIQSMLPYPYSPSLGLDQNYQNLVKFYMGQNQDKISQMQQGGMNDAQIASILNQDTHQNQSSISQQQRLSNNMINNHNHNSYGHKPYGYNGCYGSHDYEHYGTV